MKHFFYVLFLLPLLGSFSTLTAQDGKISIELNRDEDVAGGLFVKNNGFWLITNTNTAARGLTDNRLIKFNTDLSKQEYVVDGLKNLDLQPMYDPKYPDYIYFHHYPLSMNPFNAKVRYYQINKRGKLRTYEEEKERDKEVDESAGVFNSMGCLGEIWTKKKSKNEMVLILHDHENFKMTKKILDFGERKDKKKFRSWLYAGSSDNILVVLRHEKDVKSYLTQVLVIDMKLGKVISNFDYEPKLKSQNNMVIPATMGNSSAKGIALYGYESFIHRGNVSTPEDFRENGHGHFSIAKDGKSLYYYTLTSDEKVEKNAALAQMSFHGTAKGFALIKMGLDGKEIYMQETPFKYKELGAELKNGYKGLTFFEQNNGQIRLEMNMESSAGLTKTSIQRYSMFYDPATGKQVNHCLKGVKLKMRVAQPSKVTVESMEDLYPCFIKNEEKISKYIATKKIDGLYNIFTDGETQVLSIFVKKEQTLGLMYFKE